MKYIILILLTAFSFSVKSQSIYTPMTAGGYQMKYVKVDSGFALPFRDTTIGRGVDRPGLMVVNPQDSLPYYYSGSRWKPVYVDSSGVIEMINGKIDSITVNGNNIFYWVAGLGYGQQLNKLDSIHVSSDSIFTCIAGNCTFQYLTTAGTGTVTQIIAGFGLLPDTITASGTLAVDTSVFHTSNWNNAAYAAISHTHSASDIISGTLPIVRGGTGLSGIGAVGQELRVAASGTALEYFTPNYASQTYVDSLNSVKTLSGSYYGIISGGVVTYSGTGYTYYVSACKYMIGGVVYNSRDTSITLTAADATDPRIDLFAVDTLNRVVKITGTAAATPLTPQVDPASQIALTTGITLPPTSTTPTGTSSTLIYDENTEWTTGGTATVDFNNTAQPYHGTKDAYVSAYSKNSNLTFTNGSTVTVSGQILRLFIRLNNSNYSFQVQFFNGSTAVSSIITAPVNNSLFGSYQNISIPLSSFSWSSTAFNKLAVTMTGKGGTGTFYLDYVSLESGTPIITPPTDYSNKLDSVFLSNDSLFQYVKGVRTFRGLATGSSGGIDSSAYSSVGSLNDSTWYLNNKNGIKQYFQLTQGTVGVVGDTVKFTNPNFVKKTDKFPIGTIKPILALNDSTLAFDSLNLTEIRYSLAGRDTTKWTDTTLIDKKYFNDRLASYTPGTTTDTSHLSDRIDANTSNIAINTTAIGNKVDKSTTISINGVTQDLSTNRSWTISGSSGTDSSAYHTTQIVQDTLLVLCNLKGQCDTVAMSVRDLWSAKDTNVYRPSGNVIIGADTGAAKLTIVNNGLGTTTDRRTKGINLTNNTVGTQYSPGVNYTGHNYSSGADHLIQATTSIEGTNFVIRTYFDGVVNAVYFFSFGGTLYGISALNVAGLASVGGLSSSGGLSAASGTFTNAVISTASTAAIYIGSSTVPKDVVMGVDAAVTNRTLLLPRVTTAQRNVINNTVTSVTITNGGSGYTSAPSVVFSSSFIVSGATATGTAVISGGVVTGITITNAGSYNGVPPTITFSGGGGTGAAATANMTQSLTIGGTIFCTDCTANDSSTGVQQTWNGSTWKNCW